ncbi:MAG TPA: GNAT family N-acetyltransferase [Steroidobacteraceae bacterium]|nr:GNAT family N-acetyltransferase [Steroidobacteraceae bacterium]
MLEQQHTHRVAVEADLPAIVAIYNETIASRLVTADLEPVSIDSRRAWFADHRRATRPLWVVEQQDATVAWLSFSSFYGRPAYEGTAEVSVYVAGRARRRGIATHLLCAAAAAAPQLGLRTLLGFIFGHNEPSLQLFARSGYEKWGRLPRVAWLDGVERDLVIVGRRIAGAAGSQA